MIHLFLTEEKLIRRQAEVGKHRYIKVTELAELELAEDEDGKNGVCPESVVFDGIIRLNEQWSGRDRYVWLRATAVLPEKKAGFKLAGRFDFGKSGASITPGLNRCCL